MHQWNEQMPVQRNEFNVNYGHFFCCCRVYLLCPFLKLVSIAWILHYGARYRSHELMHYSTKIRFIVHFSIRSEFISYPLEGSNIVFRFQLCNKKKEQINFQSNKYSFIGFMLFLLFLFQKKKKNCSTQTSITRCGALFHASQFFCYFLSLCINKFARSSLQYQM